MLVRAPHSTCLGRVYQALITKSLDSQTIWRLLPPSLCASGAVAGFLGNRKAGPRVSVVVQTGRRFASITSNMCRVRRHRARTSGWAWRLRTVKGVCAYQKACKTAMESYQRRVMRARFQRLCRLLEMPEICAENRTVGGTFSGCPCLFVVAIVLLYALETVNSFKRLIFRDPVRIFSKASLLLAIRYLATERVNLRFCMYGRQH